jgi:DmsE family decaheme c-type cytochrome
MRPFAIGGIALLLFLGLAPGPADAVAQEAPPPAEQTQAAPPATTSCGDCHDEQVKNFLSNPHARGEVKNGVIANAVCETCHGDGTEHMDGGGDTAKITVPRGRAGADETCLTCHEKTTDKRSHRSGAHANSAAVNCLSCHSVHKAEDPATLVKSSQLELCSTCHTQATSFRSKPYAHRMGKGGLTCSSCHDPHARPGKDNLKLTAAGELPCLGCHTDKRGPFVFQHGGSAVGDCTNCHEPHGSSNPKQLKRASVQQLCVECHSPFTQDTLGSQPPSFHNTTLPRYQNCTTCHVTVHGSNRSPQLLK